MFVCVCLCLCMCVFVFVDVLVYGVFYLQEEKGYRELVRSLGLEGVYKG